MKSKYLSSAEDISIGDKVIVDGFEDSPGKVIYVGEIFSTVEFEDGSKISLVRDRVTKIDEDTQI